MTTPANESATRLDTLFLDRIAEQIEIGDTFERFAVYHDDPVAFVELETDVDTLSPDMRRVLESVRDYPVTIAISANSTGKTHGAGRAAIWFYKTRPEAQVYTTQPPPVDNLRRQLWGEIYAVTRRRPELFRDDVVKADLNREPRKGGDRDDPRSFITGVAIPTSGTPEEREAKFAGKHALNVLFIVDESDAVPEEILRAIESSMTSEDYRLLLMFNPKIPVGPIYRMIRDRRANVIHLSALNHPNVITGEEVIPGAVSRATVVRRINEWTRPAAPGEKVEESRRFTVPDFLVGVVGYNRLGEPYPALEQGDRIIVVNEFSYMVVGDYPPEGVRQLIPRAAVEAARSRWDLYVSKNGEDPPVGIAPLAGLDVAEFGEDLNAHCRRYGGFVPRLATWNGLDPDATAIQGYDIAERYRIRITFVDATGVGAGVAPRMNRLVARHLIDQIEAISVKVAKGPNAVAKLGDEELGTFRYLYDQIWWATRDWLVAPNSSAMLPPDEDLIEELLAPTYEVVGDNVVVTSSTVLREILQRSPDRAMSLVLTFTPESVGDELEVGRSPTAGYRG